ncbi:MAG: T9SS type A sorting domain-containing protein [Bacteroidetes bacterium]|nr:T9SS type A sorting domain-containing protein [Bacteroidota bacterium]
MKRMLLAVFSALCFGASAQITITNAVFPNVGDTLHYVTDAAPDNTINPATPPGGSQNWDFSALKPDQPSKVVYKAPSAGTHAASFPGADLLVIGQTGESYYNKTNTKVELLGYAGGDPANFGVQVLAKFNPAVTIQANPTNFFDILTQTTNLTIPFSTAGLPDSLFGGINIDSMRVRINTQALAVMDAFGNCTIPGGTYPVLRQKRTEYTTTKIDVKVPFLGWIDISTFIPNGGGFGNFLGTDTTVTYHFLSGTQKEEIAVATMSNDLTQVESVLFKDNMTTAVEDTDAPGSAGIQAFPNPAVEWVRFDCKNLPSDWYTLKIFNILGKVVWVNDFELSGNKSIRLELQSFKKGTYLYSLIDSKGNVVGTKRLVVVKP